MNSKLNSLVVGVLTTIGVAGAAHATNMFNPVVSSTQVLDGASLPISGTINDTNNNSQPWTAEIYAGVGQCLRLFVTSTTFDSKLTVVAPNGAVYRDDDSGQNGRPLVKIASAPVTGWYTVQVADWLGRPTNANFTMLYGTYYNGNVNCANGTVALIQNPIFPKAPKEPQVYVEQDHVLGSP